MLHTPRPTPTCAHFQATEVPCARCHGQMRLILSEPRSSKFEVLTYHCAVCDTNESFLMAIPASKSRS